MLRLKVIVGSTREGRAAERVIPWLTSTATAHGSFDVELLDLRDWSLPMFSETVTTVGNPQDPVFSDPVVREWNRKIGEGDAFVFLTPEYNHSVPAVLKNAIDSVFTTFSFRNKPFSSVGYSGGIAGASRAIEHLAQIGIESEMVPLRNSVLIPYVNDAFDSNGALKSPQCELAATILFDDLAWWAAHLKQAREEGSLPPAFLRITAANREGEEGAVHNRST